MFNKIKKIIWIITSLRYKLSFKKFGRFSYLKSPIFLNNTGNIQIGNNVKIWHHARLEAVKKYQDNTFNPSIIIEDNVAIQQNFHCTCASEIRIGKGTLITQNVGIFDIHHNYHEIDKSIIHQDIKTRSIEIGENCFIGMNTIILPGTKLGKQNIIGAGAVVSGKFPDYCVIAGTPAKVIKKYNFITKQWEKCTEGGEF